MEYTVQKLSRLAGVSTRTLRYYDEIGILKPARVNSSGYRIYGQQEIDRLQQILFYRQMEIGLEQIKELVTSSTYEGTQALRNHRNQLLDKRKQLDILLMNLDHTIAASEGKMSMSNKEKFEGFKKKLVEDNEAQYGQELRSKYGEDTVEQLNQKVLNMTQDEHDAVTKLADQLAVTLVGAIKTGNPASELAQQAAELHKQWLTYYWSSYSKEAHAGVAQMYVDDERFTAFYDKIQPGAAIFLRDAIVHFTES